MSKDIMDKLMDNIPNSYEQAQEYMNINKNIKSYIDMNKFVDKVIDIIDKSKSFAFRSDRAKRYINKEFPTFILNTTLLDPNTSNKLKGKNQKTFNLKERVEIDGITDKITKSLQKEILSKISKFFTDCIVNKDDFDKLFKEFEIDDVETLISSIYILRVSVPDNCIYLSLFR